MRDLQNKLIIALLMIIIIKFITGDGWGRSVVSSFVGCLICLIAFEVIGR